MALHLPEFSVNLSTADQDIKALFAKAKPEWNSDKIIIETLSGGFSCLTSRVYLENNVADTYIVRVKKLIQTTEHTFVDSEFEVKVVQHLSKIGLFPLVLAVFENGFCYQYILGKPIVHVGHKKVEKNDDSFSTGIKLMVEKLAEINSIKLENEDYSQSDFLTKLGNMLQNNYKATTSVDKMALQKEFDEIKNYIGKFDLQVTLCHGDAHPGNVVYNKDEGHVTFVDWELSHIGYHVYDVAYCLRLFTFQEIVPIGGFPVFPDEQSKEKFKKDVLKCYFDKWSHLNSIKNNEETFSEFCRQVGFFELVWHLAFIVTLGSFLADESGEDLTDLPVNLLEMLSKTFSNYCRIKENSLRSLNLI